MSTTTEDDVWADIAEVQDDLEVIVERDLPFATYAQCLLDKLEQEGYR